MGKRVVLSNIVSRLSVLPVRISARRVVSLGLVAGYIDALSFVDLGGIFAGAMTGNTTHMGALFIDGHWQHALLRMSVLIIFLGMAILASLIRLLCSSLYVIGLAIVLMLFAQLAYGSFYWRYVGELIILPALLAIQGAAFTRFSGTPMPTIVVTTNLLKAASGVAGVIASRLLPEKMPLPLAGSILLPTLSWFSFLIGVMLGAVILATQNTYPFLLPVPFLAFLYWDVFTAERAGQKEE